MKPHKQQVIRL